MSKTLLIAFNGLEDNGQCLGDQHCCLRVAYEFAENAGCDKILLAMSPSNELHFIWQKFIDKYNVDVVYDTFGPSNNPERWEHWNRWRAERQIEGRKFDVYKELYLRIHGNERQTILCGKEAGLCRKNIFEYYYYGQETVEPMKSDISTFTDDLAYHKVVPAERGVYIAPRAKCQGNYTFTMEFWERVVRKLMDFGITVTVGHNGSFCDDLHGHPLYRKHWGGFRQLYDEIGRHKLVACGNTGVGWVAAACGIPLLAMQPENSNMPDYRYEKCGVRSLVEIVDQPDADYVAKRIVEEVNRIVVMTTGCYDVLHAGHVRHLDQSRALGTKLVVALNSDASVKRLKGDARPHNDQQKREYVLRGLRSVDDVRIFDGDTAEALIREIKPDVLTNGFGHKAEEIVGKSIVEEYGGRAVITVNDGDYTELSTTRILPKIIRQADILKAVQDASSVSPNPYGKLKLLADEFLKVANLPGDMADLGAYRGGCSLILRRLAPSKELHLLDTWCGNPFHDPLCHHGKGEWKADIDECKAFVGNGPNTHYRQGVFPDTAKEIEDRGFCFVVVDPDTYPAVRDAIAFFWPRMVEGGRMFFDDYGWEPCAGVQKAVDEYFRESERTIYAQLHTCVVVKK